jgi:integrase/recombinase XerD
VSESLATYHAAPISSQAATDEQLLHLWLGNRPTATRSAYEREAGRFLAFIGTPIGAVTLGDVHASAESLQGAPATKARALAAIKSLLGFAHRLGYIPFNVAAAVRLPKVKQARAERILPEAAVHRLLALEVDPRNHALLRLAYASGVRVSELVALKWRDCQARDVGGQVTIFGKGGATRAVLLPQGVWDELLSLRGDVGDDGPVFRSRKGGHLDRGQAWRIIKAAARRAGLSLGVSPHWLRHAHASHALDRGAPIHLVQQTLGHASAATTSVYLHARPGDSSSRYLAV